MADTNIQIPVTGTGDTGPKKIDTRTVDTDEHRQVVVVGDPSTTAGVAAVDATYGVKADVSRIGTADNTIGRVKLTDGTTVATVRELGTNDALNVALVDGSGNQMTSFCGSSAADHSVFTESTSYGTTIMGIACTTGSTVGSGDAGAIAMSTDRHLKIHVASVDNTIDVAHDSTDTGNPVKVGFRAALTSSISLHAVSSDGDRVDSMGDRFGRLMVAHIDPAQQTTKHYYTTSLPTSAAAVWTPGSGKKIALTYLSLASSGTTAYRFAVWFGASGDTDFTSGTDQPVFVGKFMPSSTVAPGAILPLGNAPIYCTTADYVLKVETLEAGAGGAIDIVAVGYEW